MRLYGTGMKSKEVIRLLWTQFRDRYLLVCCILILTGSFNFIAGMLIRLQILLLESEI
jgi:hypothetical protein